MPQSRSLSLGAAMFTAGFLLTTYHASILFDPKRRAIPHLIWAMIGIGLFQMGSNLTASGIHDRLINQQPSGDA
jgi:vacuolar-type H+-ATPase subunit I/STV1